MKNVIVKLLYVFLLLSAVSFLSSCDFDESENNFSGGELLDRERLSEIRGELSEIETESAYDQVKPESESTETVEECESETDVETDGDDDKNKTVYWTESGTVWHLTPQCSRLSKSKEIISGTVSEAKEAKKERVCSFCGK